MLPLECSARPVIRSDWRRNRARREKARRAFKDKIYEVHRQSLVVRACEIEML